MNRRTFTKSLALSAAAVGLGGVPAIARRPAPQFSITMDDFHWHNAVKLTATERNQAILDTLHANSSKLPCSSSAATSIATKENNCSPPGTKPAT
jgi:hypothetical protein